ncbi:MAG: DUF1015 family protein [Proteobacteria bacterium]|nr:DUF1015 family protein [Pseudomonadota bacterium]
MFSSFIPLNIYSTWQYNKPDHKFLDQTLEGINDVTFEGRKKNIENNVKQVFESIQLNECDSINNSIFSLKITCLNTNVSSVFYIGGINLKETKILKHETIIDESIIMYDRLMHEYHLQLSPIILVTKSRSSLSNLDQEFKKSNPFKSYIESGYKFEIFKSEINHDSQSLEDFFKNDSAYYLIDGHHRLDFFERNIEKYPHCLVAIGGIDTMQMNVRPRVLHIEKMRPEKDACILLEQFFEFVDEQNFKETDYILKAYQKTFILRLKDDLNNQKNFDISPFVADEIILKKSLCQNYSSAKVTTLTGHWNNAQMLTQKIDDLNAQAIVIPAIFHKKTFLKCAQNNLYLPPQSTWFYPKIPEGLFIYDFSK